MKCGDRAGILYLLCSFVTGCCKSEVKKNERTKMKKRILVLVAAALLAMGMMACGKGGAENETVDMTAVEVLENVWTTYGEDEKFFAMGGDMNNMVDGAPGAYSMDDTEALAYTFQIPAEAFASVDEAASLLHAMNANTFTGGAFHLTDVANTESFVASVKDGVMNAQWMCGFPEKLVVITVHDEFVVSAFGNGEIIENFKNKVTTVYGENAVILVEESL